MTCTFSRSEANAKCTTRRSADIADTQKLSIYARVCAMDPSSAPNYFVTPAAIGEQSWMLCGGPAAPAIWHKDPQYHQDRHHDQDDHRLPRPPASALLRDVFVSFSMAPPPRCSCGIQHTGTIHTRFPKVFKCTTSNFCPHLQRSSPGKTPICCLPNAETQKLITFPRRYKTQNCMRFA